MQTVQIHTVTYNAAARAFEARVSLTDAGEVFTYPCSLRAPIDLDSAVATRRLAELARRKHLRATRPTLSRRPANLFAAKIPAEVSNATDALWQRMLGHAA